MRYVPLLFPLLLGCGGAPFSAEALRAQDDAATDGAPAVDSGPGGAEASSDGGSGVDAPAEAQQTQEAGAGDAACQPRSAFPDGGYACGASWIGAQGEYVCVQKADGGEATLSPVAAFCPECAAAPVCAHCNGPSACAIFGLTFAGCSDDGGELLVVCR